MYCSEVYLYPVIFAIDESFHSYAGVDPEVTTMVFNCFPVEPCTIIASLYSFSAISHAFLLLPDHINSGRRHPVGSPFFAMGHNLNVHLLIYALPSVGRWSDGLSAATRGQGSRRIQPLLWVPLAYFDISASRSK
jgi:hypothetical protein